MKKLVLVVGLLVGLAGTVRAELTWGDFIYNAEGDMIKFTMLKEIAPSYFYNAMSGRQEIGATTEIFQVGKFVSADVGFSAPYTDDKLQGTVIVGGNLHINRLISVSFPNSVLYLKELIPSMRRFWESLNIGVYVGHDTTRKELAGGVYSGLSWKF